jgi:hypothetical protein
MKAQTDSNSRGQKDFICREEKRKTAYWGMQGDRETSDPLRLGGEWDFIAFLHCLMTEMPFRYKQEFPVEEKCLLDHLSPSFCSSYLLVSSSIFSSEFFFSDYLFLKYYFIISTFTYMCIYYLSNLLTLFCAESVLPSCSPILLKKNIKDNKKNMAFFSSLSFIAFIVEVSHFLG